MDSWSLREPGAIGGQRRSGTRIIIQGLEAVWDLGFEVE